MGLNSLTKNELMAWAITEKDNPLVIVDFIVPPQETRTADWECSPEQIVQYQGWCLDKEIPVEQCNRIQIHSHPGLHAPSPSKDDWDNLQEGIGHPPPPYFIMLISNSRGQKIQAWIRHSELGFDTPADVTIDFAYGQTEEEKALYQKYLKENVLEKTYIQGQYNSTSTIHKKWYSQNVIEAIAKSCHLEFLSCTQGFGLELANAYQKYLKELGLPGYRI